MESRLQSMINYLNEVIRLKEKYPKATSFIKLSELYPEYFSNSDIVLATRKDDLGINMKVFEEKDTEGVIETDFIPIEYHSSYASVVAQKMKEYISEKRNFFEEFLKDYEKIVVDVSAKANDGELVIYNYEDNVPIEGYSMQGFVEAVLSKYGINLEKNPELIGRLSSSAKPISKDDESYYAKLNYVEILSNGGIDFTTLANYYATNGRYADLKFLFENKHNPRAILHQIVHSEPFEFLNDTLDYMPKIISENSDILKHGIDVTILAIRCASNYGEASSSISCDKQSTVQLVSNMLKEIDPSGEFSDEFDNALDNGLLLSYEKVNEDEEDYVAYKRNSDGILEIVDMSTVQRLPFSKYVNLTATNTLIDVVDLADGFIRYYMSTHNTNPVNDYQYISETIPAYYEYRTCSWLADEGFDMEEVRRIFDVRRADCLGTSKIDATPLMVDLVDKKAKNSELSIDNILSEQDVETRLNFRKDRGLAPISDDDVRKGYASNCAEMFMVSRGRLNTELVGYSLGYELGKSTDLAEMDERMMWVINNCSNTNYEATDLVGVLRNGVPYTAEDDYVTSDSKEMNEMLADTNRFEFISVTDLENSSGPTTK